MHLPTMRFALLIQGSPSDSESCSQALRFAQAVVRKKHNLSRVFFYKEAVRIADDPSTLSDRMVACRQKWLEFAFQHRIELQVCVGASERRSIRVNRETDTDEVGFEVVGLGQFVESTIECDRVVTFD